TQALVIIGRKLARIAFSLMKNLSEYQSKAVLGASPKP
ncbi:IS110 family transposase, partial [Pseudomonas gessardii]|nr:IS110 family transposase [Pseudomonas gessardii]MRU53153.1 IS110 family transposase [Pseudomonas gessardii]MRU53801.1 IS110 family transposase [Pseudomonas gessardii]MRU53838.1 IS110 family transposase [Pseudomonas gessardii]MRU54192.1 IS110 family transposase [Pseudomonas gessardii]